MLDEATLAEAIKRMTTDEKIQVILEQRDVIRNLQKQIKSLKNQLSISTDDEVV